jgi:hypothetical protein
VRSLLTLRLSRMKSARIRRPPVLRVVMLAGVLALALGATPAVADVVQGQFDGTWIWVGTGAKNSSNHTQWVSYITVMTGSGGACPGKLEGWTSGFYAAQQVCGSTAITWYISRWISSGNAVCGASLNRYGGRDVACISIRV